MNHSTSAGRSRPSASVLVRTTRMIPSEPSPEWRSVSRRTVAGSRSGWSIPSGSGRSTKSFCVPWPLTKGNRLSTVDDRRRSATAGERALDQVVRVVGKPFDARVLAEPRVLPTGEAPGRPHGLGPRLVLGPLPRDKPQHLGVAQRSAGRPAPAKSRLLEVPHLVDEPGAPHPVHPGGDALVERIAGEVQTQLDHAAVGVL